MSRKRRRSSVRVLVAWAAFPVALALALWATWLTCGFQGCPDPGELGAYRPDGAPILLDREGQEIARLHPLETRVVPLDSLPDYVPAAFVAVEDRRFFRHRGVDWRRVVGATARNVAARGVREGASTITMQLARTLFPERVPGAQRTIARKLLEVRVAWELEARFDKEEILELYLNHVYMGAGAYGIEAVARHFFDRAASALTLGEAAFLAGSLSAPARYDLRGRPEEARERRDLILSLMEAQEAVEPSEASGARDEPLVATAVAPSLADGDVAPYFVEMVRGFLEEEFGEELYRSQLRVHTTLDQRFQAASETRLLAQLDQVEAGAFGPFSGPSYDPRSVGGVAGSEYLQGAVVFLDPGSGDVLALVGGRDHASSRYNRAVRARRQLGSAFKPFVFAGALETGLVASQPLADRPFVVSTLDDGDWSPRNYDGEFRGMVRMRQALVESLNVPTVRLALAAGLDRMGLIAESAGFSEHVPGLPAAALGTGSASPLELASGYSAFAVGGVRVEPRTVTLVEGDTGEVLFRSGAPAVRPVLDARVAYLVTDMLQDAVGHGTGAGARSSGYAGPAAGKTGTTQGGQDVWFVGYTPSVVGVVWIGFDRPRPILPAASGGRLAAPVWGAVMADVEGRGDGPDVGGGGGAAGVGWPMPSGIVERSVDPASGRAIEAGCRSLPDGSVRELFLEEFVPVADCPEGPGIRERVSGFFRGLFGRDDQANEEGEDPLHGAGDSIDRLVPGTDPDRALGAPRVPLSGVPSGE